MKKNRVLRSILGLSLALVMLLTPLAQNVSLAYSGSNTGTGAGGTLPTGADGKSKTVQKYISGVRVYLAPRSALVSSTSNLGVATVSTYPATYNGVNWSRYGYYLMTEQTKTGSGIGTWLTDANSNAYNGIRMVTPDMSTLSQTCLGDMFFATPNEGPSLARILSGNSSVSTTSGNTVNAKSDTYTDGLTGISYSPSNSITSLYNKSSTSYNVSMLSIGTSIVAGGSQITAPAEKTYTNNTVQDSNYQNMAAYYLAMIEQYPELLEEYYNATLAHVDTLNWSVDYVKGEYARNKDSLILVIEPVYTTYWQTGDATCFTATDFSCIAYNTSQLVSAEPLIVKASNKFNELLRCSQASQLVGTGNMRSPYMDNSRYFRNNSRSYANMYTAIQPYSSNSVLDVNHPLGGFGWLATDTIDTVHSTYIGVMEDSFKVDYNTTNKVASVQESSETSTLGLKASNTNPATAQLFLDHNDVGLGLDNTANKKYIGYYIYKVEYDNAKVKYGSTDFKNFYTTDSADFNTQLDGIVKQANLGKYYTDLSSTLQDKNILDIGAATTKVDSSMVGLTVENDKALKMNSAISDKLDETMLNIGNFSQTTSSLTKEQLASSISNPEGSVIKNSMSLDLSWLGISATEGETSGLTSNTELCNVVTGQQGKELPDMFKNVDKTYTDNSKIKTKTVSWTVDTAGMSYQSITDKVRDIINKDRTSVSKDNKGFENLSLSSNGTKVIVNGTAYYVYLVADECSGDVAFDADYYTYKNNNSVEENKADVGNMTFRETKTATQSFDTLKSIAQYSNSGATVTLPGIYSNRTNGLADNSYVDYFYYITYPKLNKDGTVINREAVCKQLGYTSYQDYLEKLIDANEMYSDNCGTALVNIKNSVKETFNLASAESVKVERTLWNTPDIKLSLVGATPSTTTRYDGTYTAVIEYMTPTEDGVALTDTIEAYRLNKVTALNNLAINSVSLTEDILIWNSSKFTNNSGYLLGTKYNTSTDVQALLSEGKQAENWYSGVRDAATKYQWTTFGIEGLYTTKNLTSSLYGEGTQIVTNLGVVDTSNLAGLYNVATKRTDVAKNLVQSGDFVYSLSRNPFDNLNIASYSLLNRKKLLSENPNSNLQSDDPANLSRQTDSTELKTVITNLGYNFKINAVENKALGAANTTTVKKEVGKFVRGSIGSYPVANVQLAEQSNINATGILTYNNVTKSSTFKFRSVVLDSNLNLTADSSITNDRVYGYTLNVRKYTARDITTVYADTRNRLPSTSLVIADKGKYKVYGISNTYKETKEYQPIGKGTNKGYELVFADISKTYLGVYPEVPMILQYPVSVKDNTLATIGSGSINKLTNDFLLNSSVARTDIDVVGEKVRSFYPTSYFSVKLKLAKEDKDGKEVTVKLEDFGKTGNKVSDIFTDFDIKNLDTKFNSSSLSTSAKAGTLAKTVLGDSTGKVILSGGQYNVATTEKVYMELTSYSVDIMESLPVIKEDGSAGTVNVNLKDSWKPLAEKNKAGDIYSSKLTHDTFVKNIIANDNNKMKELQKLYVSVPDSKTDEALETKVTVSDKEADDTTKEDTVLKTAHSSEDICLISIANGEVANKEEILAWLEKNCEVVGTETKTARAQEIYDSLAIETIIIPQLQTRDGANESDKYADGKTPWYVENCTTLVINKYTTMVNLGAVSATDKLDVAWGPSAEDDKSDSYSEGYGAGLKLKITLGNKAGEIVKPSGDKIKSDTTYGADTKMTILDSYLNDTYFVIPDSSVMDSRY